MYPRIFVIAGLSAFCVLGFALLIPKGWKAYPQSPPSVSFGTYVTYQFNVLKYPTGLLYDRGYGSSGALYIADSGNHVIRRFLGGTLSIVAGTAGTAGYQDGPNGTALFNYPTGLTGGHHLIEQPRTGTSYSWTELFVNDASNYVVRRICFGSAPPTIACGAYPNQTGTVAGNNVNGWVDGPGLSSEFATMGGLSPSPGSGAAPTPPFYIADSQNHTLRYWDGTNVTTFAGTGAWGFVNGYRTSAQFNCPGKITLDASGNIYVADAGNHAIRKIDTAGNVTTLAGSGHPGYADGAGGNASFRLPMSIIFNSADSYLYVADSGNNMIRRVSLSGVVSTYVGKTQGALVDGAFSQAQFSCPMDLEIVGGYMYVSDAFNNVIRRIDMVNQVVSTYIT